MTLHTQPPPTSNRFDSIGLLWETEPPSRGNPNSPWRSGYEAERVVCADLEDFPFIATRFNFRARIAKIIPVAPRDEWGGWQEGWRFIFEAMGPSCIDGKTWYEDVIRYCVDDCPSHRDATRRLYAIQEMVNPPFEPTSPWQLIGIPFDASFGS